ncbi:pleckstrin homology domain-containing family O member 1-like [Polyodon spathula]|uniref:pleckstrin homology domain-containing family O member 1-like n=1 Tax=Polyodon spathula TaxID=7913 RepID=UPI001B7E11CD|nr:pleckstrin homology domain-containing family O member 1-like [Polyodon spathula]
MKKNNSVKRGPQDTSQPASQPEKTGWIRKFCGKGIFREIWKNRFVVLKGDQLYISEKEILSSVAANPDTAPFRSSPVWLLTPTPLPSDPLQCGC